MLRERGCKVLVKLLMSPPDAMNQKLFGDAIPGNIFTLFLSFLLFLLSLIAVKRGESESVCPFSRCTSSNSWTKEKIKKDEGKRRWRRKSELMSVGESNKTAVNPGATNCLTHTRLLLLDGELNQSLKESSVWCPELQCKKLELGLFCFFTMLHSFTCFSS